MRKRCRKRQNTTCFSGAGGSNNTILDIEDSEKIQATL